MLKDLIHFRNAEHVIRFVFSRVSVVVCGKEVAAIDFFGNLAYYKRLTLWSVPQPPFKICIFVAP
jgi:hypothetical protein